MRSKFICTAFFFLIIFSGCSIKDAVKSGSDEEILRDRVMSYWDLKIKGEFDKSYEYEMPLYRKTTRMVDYIRSFDTVMVKWHSVKIDRIIAEAASASVDLTLRTEIRLPNMKNTGEHDSLLKEKWVKVDDVWYHVPSELGKNAKGM